MRPQSRVYRDISNSLPHLLTIALSVLTCSSVAIDAAPPKKTQTARSSRLASRGRDFAPAGTVDRTIDLPKRGSNEPVHICDVAADQVAIRIENAEGNPLNFRAAADKPNESWTISDGVRKIAMISRSENDLELTWTTSAPEDAECLRNTVLSVIEGEKVRSVGLRKPILIDAPVVDLSKDRWIVPVDAKIHGLAHKSLMIDVEGLVDNDPSVQALYPADGQAALGKKVRIALHDKPPHAGIQLGLLADDGQFVVKIEPIILDFNGKSRPWTIKRLKTFHATFVKTINKQERDIPRLRSAISQMGSQLSSLRARFKPGDLSAPIIGHEIDNVSEDLAHAKQRLAVMEASLPVNKKCLEALAPLGPLSEAVHQRAKLAFRVFYLAGDKEVDLLQIGKGDRSASSGAAGAASLSR